MFKQTKKSPFVINCLVQTGFFPSVKRPEVGRGARNCSKIKEWLFQSISHGKVKSMMKEKYSPAQKRTNGIIVTP